MGMTIHPDPGGAYTDLVIDGASKMRLYPDGTVDVLSGPLKVGGVAVPRMQLFAAKNASGTAVEFSPADGTGIPSWAKRISVLAHLISTTSGASFPLIQLGTSAGYATSGYASAGALLTGSAMANAVTAAGFNIGSSSGNWLATAFVGGKFTMELQDASTHVWAGDGKMSNQAGSGGLYLCGGSVDMPGIVDRLRIVTADGTGTFDSGVFSVLVEG